MFWQYINSELAIWQEREKAREERKKNLAEYRIFLESCDFIKVCSLSWALREVGENTKWFMNLFFKQGMEHWLWFSGLLGFSMQANTQWRKVQDRLEDDDRCSCLDKLDRLEVFQVRTHRNCSKSKPFVCWNNDCCLTFWCPYLLLLHTNQQVYDAWIKWWPIIFFNGRSTSEILKRRRKKRRNCKRWSIKYSWFGLVWVSMCSTSGICSPLFYVFVYQDFVWCLTYKCDGRIGRMFGSLKWGVIL